MPKQSDADMRDEDVLEYRLVDKSGTEMVSHAVLLGEGGLRVALAGREWHDVAFPGMSPHVVQERPYRDGGWTRVKGSG